MLFDWNTIAAPAALLDVQLSAPRTLTGEGLWVCLVSSGRCTASLPGASAAPAGSVLVLPPQSAAAGHLILSRAPLTLTPEDSCHLLCVQLTGQASTQFLNGLRELPYLAKGETCPAAAELMGRLAEEKPTHSRARSQLVFALLCELADADSVLGALAVGAGVLIAVVLCGLVAAAGQTHTQAENEGKRGNERNDAFGVHAFFLQ